MRRVALALVSTVAGLVALLSFKTQTTSSTPGTVAVGTDTGGANAGGATSPAGTAAAPAAGSSTSPAANPGTSTKTSGTKTSGTKTVTGDSVDTRWGPVQVQITVSGGKLTAVTAVDYPQNNGRDQEINSYAIPQLTKEALAAGSAKIDMVSGATYTSQGYIGSLQSALDKAGL